MNKLKVHFFNVPAGQHRQYHQADLGEFNEIQVTYENLKGWRDDDFTVLATYNANTEMWILTPEHATTGQPTEFTDFLINSLRGDA